MERKSIFELIREWADAKGIFNGGDAKTQLIKLGEEFGELSKAILQKDEAEIRDAIGDCVVVLTNLAHLANKHVDPNRIETYEEDVVGDGGLKMTMVNDEWITIEDCIEGAYDVIKDRTGKMSGGTFVKDK